MVKVGKRSFSNLVTQRNNNLDKRFYSTCSSVNKSNSFQSFKVSNKFTLDNF